MTMIYPLIKNPPIKENFGAFLLELVADLWVNFLGQSELSSSAVVDHIPELKISF